jgi:hypothetical protein
LALAINRQNGFFDIRRSPKSKQKLPVPLILRNWFYQLFCLVAANHTFPGAYQSLGDQAASWEHDFQ